MSMNNARLIEKDILADINSTSAADSLAININRAGKFSCQAIYTVTAQDAAVVDSADITIEDESEFEKTAHGLITGTKVRVTTSDTLPDPLALATDYFIIATDADHFQLASSLANALAGTFIELVDAGEGDQTITPVAISASVLFQKSNDGVNWIDIQAVTAISASGSVMIEQPNVAYKYFRVRKGLIAGVVDLKALTLVIGDD